MELGCLLCPLRKPGGGGGEVDDGSGGRKGSGDWLQKVMLYAEGGGWGGGDISS